MAQLSAATPERGNCLRAVTSLSHHKLRNVWLNIENVTLILLFICFEMCQKQKENAGKQVIRNLFALPFPLIKVRKSENLVVLVSGHQMSDSFRPGQIVEACSCLQPTWFTVLSLEPHLCAITPRAAGIISCSIFSAGKLGPRLLHSSFLSPRACKSFLMAVKRD